MGIFTSKVERCDKCGRMSVVDGGFSDCGCYNQRHEEGSMNTMRDALLSKIKFVK